MRDADQEPFAEPSVDVEEDDWDAVNAEGTPEATGTEDAGPEESFDTEDEEDEVALVLSSYACSLRSPRHQSQTPFIWCDIYLPMWHARLIQYCGSQVALTSAATKEIARKERERLKAQDKYKRDQLEKLRAEQNTDASSGEVRKPVWCFRPHR